MVGSYYTSLPNSLLVGGEIPSNSPADCTASTTMSSPISGNHIPQASGAVLLRCNECNMTFTNKSAFGAHIQSHTKQQNVAKSAVQMSPAIGTAQQTTGPTTSSDPYECDVCKKTFAVPARLVRHYRTHTGERPFGCDFCPKMFSVKENLQVHRRIHTKERPYKCDVCGRAFEHSGKLHRHKRIHTGERPHECNICGKTFIQSGQLVIHLRTHTGEKPYKCTVEGCGKGFTCSKQLKVHSRTHTGEKPYHCDICLRDFGYNHVLKLHRVQHYGSKCYKCTICDETFKNKKEMEAHIKGHANQIVDTVEAPVQTVVPSSMSPETDSSSCGSVTSNKENKIYKEDAPAYTYHRFDQQLGYSSGMNLLATAAVVSSSEKKISSPVCYDMEIESNDTIYNTEPTNYSPRSVERSMNMYEHLAVMRQAYQLIPQPVPEYHSNLEKSNDIIKRVEAALSVAEHSPTTFSVPSSSPERLSVTPPQISEMEQDILDLAAHKEMMSLPPRKRKMYLRDIESAPVINNVRLSSVIQFAKAS
ncbi:Krueppel homolog 1-like isoform X3 [Ctenocephalides felis]|nr:Krueppel homolog 1-like isoform X3 [Ctenocephalides felis]